MTKIIDGKKIAQNLREKIKDEIATLTNTKPGLAFILIGDNTASQAYVRMKKTGCKEVGIHSEVIELPQEIPKKHLLDHINTLNRDPSIHGILVQQPLPLHLSTKTIIEAVDPQKDVDGFHPLNIGKILLGEENGFISCTPLGIITLISTSRIETDGKHVVIVGRSNIVGKPLAALLVQNKPYGNATVTIAHSHTKNLKEITQLADILIVAIGKPRFITKEMIKPGASIIDVGINRIKTSQGQTTLVGDVAFDEVKPLCSHITPVPGGVGPMTIAMLLSNTLLSYQRKHS